MNDKFPRQFDETSVDRLLTEFFQAEVPAEFHSDSSMTSSNAHDLVRSGKRSSRSNVAALGMAIASICIMFFSLLLHSGVSPSSTARSTINPTSVDGTGPTDALPVHTESDSRWLRTGDTEAELEMLHPELTIEVFPIPDGTQPEGGKPNELPTNKVSDPAKK